MKDKLKAALAALWVGAKKVGKELWSLVADGQWNFDPYKVGGFAAYVVAGILAFRVFGYVDTAAIKGQALDAAVLGILTGLVSLIAGLGTSLFGMARKVDAAQVAANPTAGAQ